ncbi:uncharacterized protein LACBIDRAFT_307692 [Laccaria bicolor S238N-H82]|uniref:Predicted protein n=1 Tax=Laccaria bicolor (strain S238N-H82 / ATCC MYA-4686) TaxID=486041 RepID=B0DQR3_LACBS|nr:uncharacterized protein LACBIDRAFT_307692 [Laccaria bicolor S238N-H82]EDR03076.1 predicted protein [Laccaria bicolor S238N-H82]|eukprot:XP_001886217.1 predicted protein [Laccaria bicolor S238N-H82]
MQTQISLYMLPAPPLRKLLDNVGFPVLRERVHRLNPGPQMVCTPRVEHHIRRRHMSNRRQTEKSS